MKNTILFAILAFSINVMAQNLHPTSKKHLASSNPIENFLSKMKDDGAEKTSN